LFLSKKFDTDNDDDDDDDDDDNDNDDDIDDHGNVSKQDNESTMNERTRIFNDDDDDAGVDRDDDISPMNSTQISSTPIVARRTRFVG
jgi:hypothetical protein